MNLDYDILVHHVACPFFPAELLFSSYFADSTNTFWLDSAKVEKGLSRYSYMGNGDGPLRFSS